MRELGASKGKYIIELFLLGIAILVYYIWMPSGHDASVHMARIVNEAELIKAHGLGRIPYYIFTSSHNSYGYGAPLFYCDLFLYPFAFMVKLGVDKIVAYKLLFVCTILLAFFNAYISVCEWKKNNDLAFYGALLYIFHPYFASDVVDRAALGEALALALAPIVLCGLYMIFTQKYRKGVLFLAIGMSGVVCSHVISTFLLIIFLCVVCICRINMLLKTRKIILFIGIAALLCIGLTMWFWFPMMEQLANISFSTSTAGDSYTEGLVSIYSLFVPYGLNELLYYKFHIINKFSTYIPGGMIWLVIAIAIYMIMRKNIRKNKLVKSVLITEIIILLLSGSRLVCSMTQNLFRIMQFPWRWYILLVPISVIGFVEIIDIEGEIAKRKLVILMVALTLLTVMLTMTRAMRYNDLKTNYSEENSVSMDSLYVPSAFDSKYLLDHGTQVISDVDEEIIYARDENEFFVQSIDTDKKDFTMTFPLFMYEGYAAENLLTEQKYVVRESEDGLVQAQIADYQGGDIKLYYKGTVIQRVSRIWSVICAVLLLVYGGVSIVSYIHISRKIE